MKRILIVTVGTSKGDEESQKKLAHGIAEGIRYARPDEIYCAVSKDSKENTVKHLKEELKGEYTLDNFIVIDDIDKFSPVFKRIHDKIEEIKSNKDEKIEVTVDYTSGTKTMSASAVIAGLLTNSKLQLVSGYRGKHGTVEKGGESPQVQNAYEYNYINTRKEVDKLFNWHLYYPARKILEDYLEDTKIHEEEVNILLNLLLGYESWDRFDHKGALEHLAEAANSIKSYNKSLKSEDKEIKIDIRDNMNALGTMLNAREDIKRTYMLADLIENAARCIDMGHYDDAVARLYRAIELIAQIKLLAHGIDDSNITKEDINRLKDTALKNKLMTMLKGNGKVQVGLDIKYKILNDLGDTDASGIYLKNNKLKDLLGLRNNSILAHGLTPVSEENARELMALVDDIASNLENYNKYREKVRFPEHIF